MEKLIDTLDSFGRPKVVLVGDLMLDEIVYGDAERISPEAPVPVLRTVRREYRCGGAANAAAAAAALGAEVVCVGLTGADAGADQLLEELRRAGVRADGVVRAADRPTTVKRRFVGLAQHRHAQQMLRVDDESVQELSESLQDQILAAAYKQLAGAKVLALEDYNKGVLTARTVSALIAAARERSIPVVVDPAGVADFARYRGATLLKPNRFEAQLASGVPIASEASMEAAAERILQSADAQAVAITLDKEGAYLKVRGRAGRRLPTRPRTVYDVTGAGDVVLAMLAVALAAGSDLDQAVLLANVAGGLEVERFGVVPVTRDEVRDELRHLLGLRRSKIMDRARLAAELERVRRGGGTVVFTNGCFDLLHMGHVSYLQQAREHGTCLVVAINSDDSVRRLKGPKRPVIGQDERAEMLAALECVDFVTVFEEDTPEALLEALRPEVLVKGGSTDEIVGRKFVERYGGVVKRLELVAGMSTTDIIQRILQTHDLQA